MKRPDNTEPGITAFDPKVKPKQNWLTLADWIASKTFWKGRIAELQKQLTEKDRIIAQLRASLEELTG